MTECPRIPVKKRMQSTGTGGAAMVAGVVPHPVQTRPPYTYSGYIARSPSYIRPAMTPISLHSADIKDKHHACILCHCIICLEVSSNVSETDWCTAVTRFKHIFVVPVCHRILSTDWFFMQGDPPVIGYWNCRWVYQRVCNLSLNLLFGTNFNCLPTHARTSCPSLLNEPSKVKHAQQNSEQTYLNSVDIWWDERERCGRSCYTEMNWSDERVCRLTQLLNSNVDQSLEHPLALHQRLWDAHTSAQTSVTIILSLITQLTQLSISWSLPR